MAGKETRVPPKQTNAIARSRAFPDAFSGVQDWPGTSDEPMLHKNARNEYMNCTTPVDTIKYL